MPRSPIEPPETRWRFPAPDLDDHSDDHSDDLIAVGADLEPGTLLAAYRSAYFPMPIDEPGGIGWWSPNPRAVIELDQLRISRSLRRSIRHYEIRIDTAFGEVIEACGDPTRPHGWINDAIISAYTRLHTLGWAHSIEAWDDQGLAGGLYGVSIGNFFAAESMFHRRTDAGKVALAGLVRLLRENPGGLLDVQWSTPHLQSLGATELNRSTYVQRLVQAARLTGPEWSSPG